MTDQAYGLLVVEVEVLADLVEDALNDLVDDGPLAGRVGVLVSPSPAVRGAALASSFLLRDFQPAQLQRFSKLLSSP
jgi:hypothetical protein